MSYRNRIRQRITAVFNRIGNGFRKHIVKWTSRWVLPIVFYGLGLGFLFPMVQNNLRVGWWSQEGLFTRTETDKTVYESELCQSVVEPDGTTIDTCMDTNWANDVDAFGIDSFGLTELLIPVRLIVGLVVLAIAYKLTPKPQPQ